MNALMTIKPYRHNGMWVFDDESAGLIKEPFVLGIDLMIDRLTDKISCAKNGFNMVFLHILFLSLM